MRDPFKEQELRNAIYKNAVRYVNESNRPVVVDQDNNPHTFWVLYPVGWKGYKVEKCPSCWFKSYFPSESGDREGCVYCGYSIND